MPKDSLTDGAVPTTPATPAPSPTPKDDGLGTWSEWSEKLKSKASPELAANLWLAKAAAFRKKWGETTRVTEAEFVAAIALVAGLSIGAPDTTKEGLAK